MKQRHKLLLWFFTFSICLFIVLYTIKNHEQNIKSHQIVTKLCNIYHNKFLQQQQQHFVNISFPSNKVEFPGIGNLSMFHFGPTDLISKHFIEDGKWELHLLKPLINLLQHDATLQFIDLGTNLGLYTLAAASLKRQVVAVEAMKVTCERAYATLSLHGLTDYVTLVNNALSDERGQYALSDNPNNIGGTNVVHNVVNSSESIMRTIFMDDLLEVIDFDRAIMKMDIEGSEYRALRHASKLFATVDIPLVMFEWGSYKNATNHEFGQEIIDFFLGHGYQPFGSFEVKFQDLDLHKADNWPWDIVWRKHVDYLYL